jgi:hypothetical protein
LICCIDGWRERFWDDFDKEQDGEAKRMDELMDELYETEGFDEEIHMRNLFSLP